MVARAVSAGAFFVGLVVHGFDLLGYDSLIVRCGDSCSHISPAGKNKRNNSDYSVCGILLKYCNRRTHITQRKVTLRIKGTIIDHSTQLCAASPNGSGEISLALSIVRV
jgi:hypothetical protein